MKKYVPNNKGWSYIASLKFGNLKKGKNIYNIYAVDFNDKKTLVDSIVINQGSVEDFDASNKEKIDLANKNAPILPSS